MAAEQELGAEIERYETDNRRRRQIFVVAVPLGAVVACLGALMLVVIGGPGEAGGGVVVGIVCGLGVGAFGVGIWQGWLSVTRSGEVFTLYEGGLVHAYAGKSWAISWDEITKVTDRGSDNPINGALGGDVHYRLKLGSAVGGRRVVVITGLTKDAVWLGETVRQAVQDGIRPRLDTA